MDLIKSGSYIDIIYAKTCATTKISTLAGYHVLLATLLLSNQKGLLQKLVYVCIYGNGMFLLLQWWLQVLTCIIILDY